VSAVVRPLRQRWPQSSGAHPLRCVRGQSLVLDGAGVRKDREGVVGCTLALGMSEGGCGGARGVGELVVCWEKSWGGALERGLGLGLREP